MERSSNHIFSTTLIMFGSALSIAEILTGTFLAPLGFTKALLAILLGHLIGGILLYLAGVIGCDTGKSSMETTKLSFGKWGGLFFSSINIISLVGWTAIMIISGAYAADSVVALGITFWSVIIGAFILVWVLIGINNIKYINIAAMSLLMILTIVMSRVVFKGTAVQPPLDSTMSFGFAVELSVAMPLSWLPLISDYTKDDDKNRNGALTATLVYSFVSIWMYVIGLGGAIYCGSSNIELILNRAGLPLTAIMIVVFSTVTTTFLDVYSAGISSLSIKKNLSQKKISSAVTLLGVILALFTPISNFESFLYLLGSFFAPMISIMIADHFFLHKDSSSLNVDNTNLILWIIGFILYRVLMQCNTPFGITFPVMIAICLITIITNKIGERRNVRELS
ncbi:MAG: putative hydroxymethylpyrimidine transporter CytX [Sphaerochaetaceae bacterium]|nr:putative hydroxymethylpyrimidine transporter CytX [Sphaerochaetaceae bacterium]